MTRISRWGRYLSLALVVLFVVAAAVWTAARLTTPTASQRTAVALLEQPGEFPGRNAFGMMYTANRLVPASEIDAVLAEEARRVEQYVADYPLGAEQVPEFEPGLNRYPSLEVDVADTRMFCRAREPCLARVRAEPRPGSRSERACVRRGPCRAVKPDRPDATGNGAGRRWQWQ